mmetsp:Transcript_21603/g.47776  ORF Transcript_21603/g.47776 Transcript_21603/m.47776 type:complete len:89 (+) Transcript_21603:74-340(+)
MSNWPSRTTTISVAALATAALIWHLFREGDDDEKDVFVKGSHLRRFVPTLEWQEVEEGFACPPGLEYRMDLASGRSFARLVPPSPKNY